MFHHKPNLDRLNRLKDMLDQQTLKKGSIQSNPQAHSPREMMFREKTLQKHCVLQAILFVDRFRNACFAFMADAPSSRNR